MKFLLLALLSLAMSVYAQERETLSVDSQDTTLGGFGGPVIKMTKIGKNDTALMLGGKGALLIDQHFFVGGAMYGLASQDKYLDKKLR